MLIIVLRAAPFLILKRPLPTDFAKQQISFGHAIHTVSLCEFLPKNLFTAHGLIRAPIPARGPVPIAAIGHAAKLKTSSSERSTRLTFENRGLDVTEPHELGYSCASRIELRASILCPIRSEPIDFNQVCLRKHTGLWPPANCHTTQSSIVSDSYRPTVPNNWRVVAMEFLHKGIGLVQCRRYHFQAHGLRYFPMRLRICR